MLISLAYINVIREFYSIGIQADHIGCKPGSYNERNTLAIGVWLRDYETQKGFNFFISLDQVDDKKDVTSRRKIEEALDKLNMKKQYKADCFPAVADGGMQNGLELDPDSSK